jgi:hypothetical protein
MSKRKKKGLADHLSLSPNTRLDEGELSVLEGMLESNIREFLFTPEAERIMEAVAVVHDLLEDAGVDTKRQAIIWPNGDALDIDKTAEMIKSVSETDVDLPQLKISVMCWLENEVTGQPSAEASLSFS